MNRKKIRSYLLTLREVVLNVAIKVLAFMAVIFNYLADVFCFYVGQGRDD